MTSSNLLVLISLTFLLLGLNVNGQSDLGGLVTSEGAPVSNARLTVFNDDLSFFAEVRSTDNGAYQFNDLPEGVYTIGVAALGKEYQTLSITFPDNQEEVNFVLFDEEHPGSWEVIMDSPDPLGGTDLGILLPDGKIFYCHNTKDPFLFDPKTNDTLLIAGDTDVQGCVAPLLLPDGQLIFLGGTGQEIYGPGTRIVKTFDPTTEEWTNQPELFDYRWYPTATLLSNGKILVTGGGGLDNPVRVNSSELYNPTNFTSESVGNIEIGNEVSPIVLLYDGRAFMTHRPPQLFSPETTDWTLAADFVQSDRMPNGDHSDHELVLLPDGKVVAIGYKSFSPPNYESIVEIYNPATDEWMLGQNYAPHRSRAKTVLLPNKKILVMGGEKEDPNDPSHTNQWNYMSLTDCYDPYADSWRRLQDLNIAREYHSITILVPDGRIIAVGGEGAPGNEPALSTIEAFSPPYLFRGVRPEIHSLNQQAFLRGEQIIFDIEKTTEPTAVILQSLQSVTHFMNTGNNRYLDLDFSQMGSTVSAQVPTDSLAALPGYYLLFAMVDDIPSVAKIIKIEPGQIVTKLNGIDEPIVEIFPNPTSGLLQIHNSGNGIIQIYNAAGQLLEHHQLSEENFTLDITALPSGQYTLTFNSPAFYLSRKIIKQ